MIFDGKKFAAEIESKLKAEVATLPKKPKLAVMVDENNMGAVGYTMLKEKFAERIGVEFEQIKTLNPNFEILNKDVRVDGIMLQLPFPNAESLIMQIDPKKDVDGLRDDSPYMPAVVKAVKEILNTNIEILNKNICIVGSRGFVGKKLMKYLPDATGMDKEDFSLEKLINADIIISATGQGNLIKPEMVKDGVIAIDLGYPMGDFVPEVAAKASFFTPVPGGVGPVTVASLFANLIESVQL